MRNNQFVLKAKEANEWLLTTQKARKHKLYILSPHFPHSRTRTPLFPIANDKTTQPSITPPNDKMLYGGLR